MLWQIDILASPGQPDLDGQRVIADAGDLGIGGEMVVRSARGYLLQSDADETSIRRLARELLADAVVEQFRVAPVGDPSLTTWSEAAGEQGTGPSWRLVHVLPKPGVMDPVAQSAEQAIRDYAVPVEAVRTFRKYWIQGVDEARLDLLCGKILANDSIEQVVRGALRLDRLRLGGAYEFHLVTVPIRELDDDALRALSKTGQLYLTLVEMRTIRDHFRQLDRDPTDVELETIAQTWSEHCSHKTLAGRIEYQDEHGTRRFDNMLKETIFAATRQLRERWGENDWCVSVFADNTGVVRFDDEYNVVFKVETHNHPSAIEPYGGANTGLGGVIRDPLGTGLGAKPICNTNVFCFAPPDLALAELHPGVQHPRRVMNGVVAGVRDYGNRMGIPTVNGAIFFDRRYLGNPLVFCGNVGLLPRDKSHKAARPGDYIVALGGRTGRDGIHGATFSSAELTSESESVSGGAVQIGNAVVEKMVLDVLLQARDQGLFHAVTDCGAGGFSSAVGEMGEEIGAEVWLEQAPLKYEGLSYTEIWISEAQERMVLSVGPDQWPAFRDLCAAENVEATILGRFEPTGRLQLKYHDQVVGELTMEFLHHGRPPVVRSAVYQAPPVVPIRWAPTPEHDYGADLERILGSLNVASKEWVIRQYDHEVQGGSVIKPLVGHASDGPSDAAVVRPRLDSHRGLVISCGMNPRYGDHDPYHMATSAIDEAIRNAVAVGAAPSRIAILDNFCWGYTDRPETLGSLVRAALACHALALEMETPFISGKDSLNNEFSYHDDEGHKHTISIPPSLLISALGQVDDVRRCVTMDLKAEGNRLYQVGMTRLELGGSHFGLIHGLSGGQVPQVEPRIARETFARMHRAIHDGLVRACHDLSEGGLAVSLAEMAFSGGFGVDVDVAAAPSDIPGDSADPAMRLVARLFAESNSRFVCEIPEARAEEFERLFAGLPWGYLGRVTTRPELVIRDRDTIVIRAPLDRLKDAWQAPLRWA